MSVISNDDVQTRTLTTLALPGWWRDRGSYWGPPRRRWPGSPSGPRRRESRIKISIIILLRDIVVPFEDLGDAKPSINQISDCVAEVTPYSQPQVRKFFVK